MKLPVQIAVCACSPTGAALAQKVISPTALPAPAEAISTTSSTPAAHDWAARILKDWPVERQVLAAHLVTRYGEPPGSHTEGGELV